MLASRGAEHVALRAFAVLTACRSSRDWCQRGWRNEKRNVSTHSPMPSSFLDRPLLKFAWSERGSFTSYSTLKSLAPPEHNLVGVGFEVACGLYWSTGASDQITKYSGSGIHNATGRMLRYSKGYRYCCWVVSWYQKIADAHSASVCMPRLPSSKIVDRAPQYTEALQYSPDDNFIILRSWAARP